MSVRKIMGNDGAKIIIELVAGRSIETLMWADWINVAMGVLKGADSHHTAEHGTEWRQRTSRKCDLSKQLLVIPKDYTELPELRGDIRVWVGWPLFDIKVAQFEVNQWMQAAGLCMVSVMLFGRPQKTGKTISGKK